MDAVGAQAGAGEVLSVWQSDLRVAGVEGNKDCKVSDGGTITLWRNSLSGASQEFNKIYANGIIYKDDEPNAPEVQGRNILINASSAGNFINQRGFSGDWSSIADYEFGYDRWQKRSGNKRQGVLYEDYKNNMKYTLSGDNVTTQILTAPNSGTWQIEVPTNASNVQLELGENATKFEVRPHALELAACQKYYQELYIPGWTTFGILRCSGGTDLWSEVKYFPEMVRKPTDMSDTLKLNQSKLVYGGGSVGDNKWTYVEPKSENSFQLRMSTGDGNNSDLYLGLSTTGWTIKLSAET